MQNVTKTNSYQVLDCVCLKYFFCCLSLRKLQSILRSLFRRRYGFIRTQYNRKCNARTFGKFICFFPLQRTVIEYLACLEACNNNILQRKIIEAIISEIIMIKVYTNLTISSWYLKYAVLSFIELNCIEIFIWLHYYQSYNCHCILNGFCFFVKHTQCHMRCTYVLIMIVTAQQFISLLHEYEWYFLEPWKYVVLTLMKIYKTYLYKIMIVIDFGI